MNNKEDKLSTPQAIRESALIKDIRLLDHVFVL